MGEVHGATHVVIPDSQVKPGVPIDHLSWIGRYIVDQFGGKPNVKVIHLGDFWDLPSLSSYDKGKKSMEGRRYMADVEAGNVGMEVLNEALASAKRWKPDLHLLRGNHENRIERAIEADAQLDGLLTMDDLLSPGWQVHDFLYPVDLDGVSYCLAPDHKVLTGDLHWKSIGDLKVGDNIWGFDEDGPGPFLPRRHKSNEVLAADPAFAPLVRVELASGQVFDTTPDHQWLARSATASQWRWVASKDLRPSHTVLKVTDVWSEDPSRNAGWMAGVFDGEGHISKPNCKQGGIQLGVAQNPGGVLDRVLSFFDDRGLKYTAHYREAGCVAVRLGGTSFEKLRLLGQLRPERLVGKIRPEMLGRVQLYGGRAASKVKSVTPAGVGEIVMLKTSASTLIADGYAHHNCHYFYNPMSGRPYGGMVESRLKTIGFSFTQGHQQTLGYGVRFVGNRSQHGLVAGSAYLHSEDYRGPQGNHEWRGIIVCHEVRDGSYDPMFVSLDFLCRKYEGKPLAKFRPRVFA